MREIETPLRIETDPNILGLPVSKNKVLITDGLDRSFLTIGIDILNPKTAFDRAKDLVMCANNYDELVRVLGALSSLPLYDERGLALVHQSDELVKALEDAKAMLEKAKQ